MATVKRYDKITLDRTRAIKLDSGALRVPARLSRVGVQEYRKADGSVERAYRPAEEVGKADSVATFDLVPLVNEHPYQHGGVVDAKNFKELTVGVVGSPVYKDGFVEAMLSVNDAAAVAAVEAGKLELSAGYFVDRDETPGITADGQPYDFVQRNIRGNHVALVWKGRAGSDVRIQLDSAAAFATDISIEETRKMKKLIVDGVEVEVSEVAATLILKERTLAAGLLESAKAETAKASAQLDAANDNIKKLTAELAEAPAKAKAEVTAHMVLAAKVAKLAPEVKCDGLDFVAIKRAVLAKAGIVCDGKADAYVDARFDILCEESEKKNPATEAAEKELKAKTPAATTDAVATNPKEARLQSERDFFNPKS